MSPFIRTVLGDVVLPVPGMVYTHEHLIIDSPLVAETMSHIHLPSVHEAAAEVGACVRAGVGLMVDAMPAASGRHPARLMSIARQTGVHIVATTGLHTAKYYEGVPWTWEESPDQLAARFVADITVGIDAFDYFGSAVDRSDVRAGLIKVAALTSDLTDRDRRLFEAAVIAHRETGAPILTHTEGGMGAMQQIDELSRLGMDLGAVALSHTDKIADPGYHRDILSTGVLLCYDQPLRTPDQTADLVAAMNREGFGEQIVLGTDGARRSLWSTLGGSPGLAWLASGFPRLLADRGLDEAAISTLYRETPARYLAMGSSPLAE